MFNNVNNFLLKINSRLINSCVKIMLFLLLTLIINGIIKFASYSIYDFYLKNKRIDVLFLIKKDIIFPIDKKIKTFSDNKKFPDLIIADNLELLNHYKRNFTTSISPNIIINTKQIDIIKFITVENFGNIKGYFSIKKSDNEFFIIINKKSENNKNLNYTFNLISLFLTE